MHRFRDKYLGPCGPEVVYSVHREGGKKAQLSPQRERGPRAPPGGQGASLSSVSSSSPLSSWDRPEAEQDRDPSQLGPGQEQDRSPQY